MAAALLVALLGAAGVAHGGGDYAAPVPGDPCARARFPGAAKLPADPDCTVTAVAARYSAPSLVGVVWMTPRATGALIELLGSGPPRIVDLSLPRERSWSIEIIEPPTVAAVSDARPAVFLATSDDAGTHYRIVRERADGWGDTGAFTIAAGHSRGYDRFIGHELDDPSSDHVLFEFDGIRYAPAAGAEAPVEGLTASASSAAKGYAAGRAVDGKASTAWCEGHAKEGLGETLTVALPRHLVVSRVSFATGLDALRPKLGDLWWLNNRLRLLRLTFDGKHERVLYVTEGQRWIDLDPRVPIPVRTVRLEIDNVARGARKDWNDTCVSEVEVFARTSP